MHPFSLDTRGASTAFVLQKQASSATRWWVYPPAWSNCRVKQTLNLDNLNGLLVVLVWPISNFVVSHWLKESCQSNPPGAVFLRNPQCGLGGGGEQIFSAACRSTDIFIFSESNSKKKYYPGKELHSEFDLGKSIGRNVCKVFEE